MRVYLDLQPHTDMNTHLQYMYFTSHLLHVAAMFSTLVNQLSSWDDSKEPNETEGGAVKM